MNGRDLLVLLAGSFKVAGAVVAGARVGSAYLVYDVEDAGLG